MTAPAGGRRRAPREEGSGVMHSSITLGRIAGVEIGINWSWLVIFGLIIWSLGAAVFPTENPGLSDATYGAMAFAAAVLFFISLLLHEVGHAVVARREGMEIEGITLWLFGGVAKFKGMFPSAGAEFRIAIAGPAVTLVLGGCFLLGAWLTPLPGAIDGVITWLGYVNVYLLVFNMLPALPLDGGRVLRATVWHLRGDFAQATRFAGALGRAFGQAMVALGLVGALLFAAPGGLWLAVIGWFLIAAAGAETGLVVAREALAGLHVGDAMTEGPSIARADATVREFMDDVFARSRHSAYPVLAAGGVVGIVSFRAMACRAAEWTECGWRDRMQPLEDTLVVGRDDELGDALTELVQTPLGRAIVRSDGRTDGFLSLTDVQRLLELRRLGGSR